MKRSLGVINVAVAVALAFGLSRPAFSQQYMFPNSTGYPAMPAGYAQAPAVDQSQYDPMVSQQWAGPAAYPAEGGMDGSCGPEGCGDGSCGGGCTPRIFGTFEYVMWFPQGRSLPPLVTTNPLGTPQGQAGRLSTNTTTVLFGDGREGNNNESGPRITLGLWLDDCQSLAWAGSWWSMDPSTFAFNANSPANGAGLVNQILAVPFFNVLAPGEDSVLIAFSDYSLNPDAPINEGSININGSTDVESAETYMMMMWGRNCTAPGRGWRLDLLGGYRYSRIEDSLTMNTFSRSLDPGGLVAVGTTTSTSDSFRTRNEFNGGLIGLTGEWYTGCWTATCTGKLSVGNMSQQAIIAGSRTVVTPGPMGTTTTSPRGLLALATNSGTFEQDRCVVAPELDVNLAYRLTDHMDFTMGYTLAYWNLAAMAGNQIDRNINPTLFTNVPILPPNQPGFQFNNEEFYVMGWSLGLNVRY